MATRRTAFADRWTVLRAVRGIVLLGFAIYCLVPLVWLLLAPTKTNAQLSNDFPLSFGSLANVVDAWNHLAMFNDGAIYGWTLNTFVYTALSMVILLVTTLLAGYALATMSFAGRQIVLIATLIAMVLPGAALVLPLFLELNLFRLVNTMWAVVLPSSFYPFGAYLSYIYFSTSLPKELIESAKIDGASEWQLFSRIALPLATPLIGLLGFFGFVGNWNNFFLPYVMLSSSDLYNLPVGLGALIASTPALNPALGGTNLPIYRPEAALMGIVTILPIAIAYAVSQRFLTTGVLSGSLKG
jgi:multiple sugar transport system permease protein